IDLEVVKKGDVIAAINASEEEIQILANKISLQGFVTFEDLEGNEQVTINGGVFTGATIEGQYASIVEINCPGASIGDPKIDMTEGKINVGRPGLLGKATKIEDGKLILQNSSTDSNKTVLDGDSLSVQTATIGGTNFSGHTHTTGSTVTASLSASSNGQGNYIRFLNTGGEGATTGWCWNSFVHATASDMRLKKDIQSISYAEDIYKDLKPKSYRFKDTKEDGKKHYGLLAQQVVKNLTDKGIDYKDTALIEEVQNQPGRDDGMYCKDGKHYRINYEELHGLHIATIQSLMRRVEELEKKIK
ncbi:MAG: tail fiber domain-containing protein, partial [Bacteroidaceae bacterium]